MKIRWKKTVLMSILGIVLIVAGVYYSVLGTLNISAILNSNQPKTTVYTIENLKETAKDFEIENGKWKSLTEDSWITINLKKTLSIDKVIINLKNISNTSEDDIAQIFYSAGDEVTGADYVEQKL